MRRLSVAPLTRRSAQKQADQGTRGLTAGSLLSVNEQGKTQAVTKICAAYPSNKKINLSAPCGEALLSLFSCERVVIFFTCSLQSYVLPADVIAAHLYYRLLFIFSRPR